MEDMKVEAFLHLCESAGCVINDTKPRSIFKKLKYAVKFSTPFNFDGATIWLLIILRCGMISIG
jgi:hypothetical protein